MRLRGQVVAGFYPAALEAIQELVRYLIPPQQQPFAVLDPCAGQGKALKLLGKLLKGDPRRLYAIELSEDRARDVRSALPDGQVLAPASFFGCWASLNSFSVCWLNPPFDNQAQGEGRVELDFLRQATMWLKPGGILMLVLPANQIEDHVDSIYSDSVPGLLRQHYEQVQVVPFPAEHRPFNEVCVFAVKRHKSVDVYATPWESIQAKPGTRYRVPAGPGPATFKKVEPTEPELRAVLAASPLRARWQAPPSVQLGQPPLPLGNGHVSLLLSAGQLDGIVENDDGVPHIVRGTARKLEYTASVQKLMNGDRVVGTKTIRRERIDLVVRTLGLDGIIRTFASDPPEDEMCEED